MAELPIQIFSRVSRAIKAKLKPTGPSTPLGGLAFPVEGAEQLAKREAEQAAGARVRKLLEEAGAGRPAPAAKVLEPVTAPGAAPKAPPPIQPASARHMERFGEALANPTLPLSGRIQGANLDFTSAEESSRRVMAAVVEAARGRITRAQRGVRGHDITEGAALRLLEQGKVTPEIVAALPPGTVPAGLPISEYITATRQLRQATNDVFRDLSKRFQAGEPMDPRDLALAYAQMEAAQVGAAGAGTEVARALEAHKIKTPLEQLTAAGTSALQQRATRTMQAMTPEALAAIGTEVPQASLPKLVTNAAKLGGDLLYEYWINWGLVSKFTTVERNLLSNSVFVPLHLSERALAAQIGKVAQPLSELPVVNWFVGGGPGVQPGEATAALFGMQNALADAWRLFKIAGSEEASKFGGAPKYVAATRAWSAEALQQAGIQHEGLGRAFDYIGHNIMRLPGAWGLRAPDEFQKALWYRAALYMRAWRETKLAGISEPGAMQESITQKILDPAFGAQVEAADVATLLTFNKQLNAPGSAVLEALNSVPGLRLIVPFFQTPVNLAKTAWQRAPILSVFSIQNASDVAAGGVARDLALARIAMGNAAAVPLLSLAASGYLTGSGKSYPEGYRRTLERDFGWAPYAIYDPESKRYVQMRGMEPYALVMGMVADYYETYGRAPVQDVQDGALSLSLSLARMATQMPSVEGIGRLYEAFSRPGGNVQRVLQTFAASWAPGAVAQFTQNADPIRREYDDLLDGARDRLGMGGYLRPARDDFGRVELKETPWPLVNPLRMGKVTEDFAVKEYVRAGGNPPRIPKAIGGPAGPMLPGAPPALRRGIPLEPEHQERYGQLLESEVRDGQGRTLIEALNAMEHDPDYQRLPYEPWGDNARLARLNRSARWFHDQARDRLLREYPDLKAKHDVLTVERQKARAGQPTEFQGAAPALMPGAEE